MSKIFKNQKERKKNRIRKNKQPQIVRDTQEPIIFMIKRESKSEEDGIIKL